MISTSIHSFFLLLSLVLVVGCLITTTSSAASYATRNLLEPINSNLTEDGQVLLTFRYDLNDINGKEVNRDNVVTNIVSSTLSLLEVFMFFNLEDQRTPLPPGVTIQRSGDSQRQTGLIYWTVLCVIFYQYNPAVDGGHDAVHWSARTDGLFKSFDDKNWVLTKTWRNDNCD
ncbi:hypothetical protein PIB30_011603 [Stylosanthes scabra]|uniref:Uncharacterized protein n=1 Tax=Stylosanthes scabra TaxID=79078 RepID=A0ABU6V4T8_9FABA|nr:hypothetical protein [Stylosanthes scabra]